MNPENPTLFIVLATGISAIMAHFAIPVIVRISKEKGLYDEPNERSAATKIVPTLGGIAIFIGLIMGSILASYRYSFHELKFIIASTIILFFIGLKDDILVLAPSKKLLAQFISALILIYFANLRITNLHGFMGMHELPLAASYIISVFLMVVVINAFNLIDGIDGLASGIAITCGITFGTWFILVNQPQYAVVAFSLVGSLAVFFYYNVFSKTNKIFMGDTGSLIIGLIFSALVIKFNELNITRNFAFAIDSAPAVSFGILIVPLFDTLRVFIIRLWSKRSPFSPDKNHVHHRLLEIGFTHLQSSVRIISINIFLILVNFSLQRIGIVNLLLLNITLGIVFSFIPAYILFKRSSDVHTLNKYFVFQVKLTNDKSPQKKKTIITNYSKKRKLVEARHSNKHLVNKSETVSV